MKYIVCVSETNGVTSNSYEFKNKREAIKFCRNWVDYAYINQSKARVYDSNDKSIYSCINVSGKVKRVNC